MAPWSGPVFPETLVMPANGPAQLLGCQVPGAGHRLIEL